MLPSSADAVTIRGILGAVQKIDCPFCEARRPSTHPPRGESHVGVKTEEKPKRISVEGVSELLTAALVKEGFQVEEAVEAARAHPTNVNSARDFILEKLSDRLFNLQMNLAQSASKEQEESDRSARHFDMKLRKPSVNDVTDLDCRFVTELTKSRIFCSWLHDGDAALLMHLYPLLKLMVDAERWYGEPAARVTEGIREDIRGYGCAVQEGIDKREAEVASAISSGATDTCVSALLDSVEELCQCWSFFLTRHLAKAWEEFRREVFAMPSSGEFQSLPNIFVRGATLPSLPRALEATGRETRETRKRRCQSSPAGDCKKARRILSDFDSSTSPTTPGDSVGESSDDSLHVKNSPPVVLTFCCDSCDRSCDAEALRKAVEALPPPPASPAAEAPQPPQENSAVEDSGEDVALERVVRSHRSFDEVPAEEFIVLAEDAEGR